MKTNKFFALSSLVFFLVLYQNCALQNKTQFREVRLDSGAAIEVSDQYGKSFLSWSFNPGPETIVDITNRNNNFCKRSFILNTEMEKQWHTAFSKLKSKRNVASDGITENIRVRYKGANIDLSKEDSLEFFSLMDKTKKEHSIKITECDGQKKWSFKKIKSENIITTKSDSKVVQTFTVEVIKGGRIELKLEEQPIKITKNQDDAFCTYTGMTYEPSTKLLTAMFNVDEFYRNENLLGQRSLASQADNTMMIEIDGKTKVSVDTQSGLGLDLSLVINQMRNAKFAQKTCGYTY